MTQGVRSDPLNDDKVTLQVGDTEIRIATSFEINNSLLKQPSEFSIRLGRGSTEREPGKGPTVRDLIEEFPPNSPAKVFINDKLRMTGATDGHNASAAGGAGTEVTIFGRDALAPLHDAHIAEDFSFSNSTYKSLVQDVLKKLGLDPTKLVAGKDADSKSRADKQLKTGVSIASLLPVRTIDEILKDVGASSITGTTGGATKQILQAKFGDRWIDFIRKQLDRAGLFLWAAADGTFILSAPQVNQEPAYRIIRKRGQLRDQTNVVHASLMFDTRPRYSHVLVYGKAGRRAHGHHNSKGDGEDHEMTDSKEKGGFGYSKNRALNIKDVHCQNAAQAAFLAQRKLAEGRRQGFQLTYVMSGLSTESYNGQGRAIWAPDTCVDVIDEEFGLNEIYWIDSCDFRRNPQTTTTLRLLRKQDLVFGTPNFEGAGNGVSTGFANLNVRNIDKILKDAGKKR